MEYKSKNSRDNILRLNCSLQTWMPVTNAWRFYIATKSARCSRATNNSLHSNELCNLYFFFLFRFFLAWNKFRWSMFLYSFAALNIFAIVVISLHYAIMYRFVIIWNVWVWVSARLDCQYVVSCFRGLATMSTGNELRSLSHSDIMFIKLECAWNVHTVKWRHADMYQMCVCVSVVRSFKVQPMILEKRKRKYVFIDFYPCHSVECNFLIYLQI